MKKIYLILAHKSPEQLEKQINALFDEQSKFYIHIDLKSDLNLFNDLKKIPNVVLIKERVDCIWGDFNIITATLNLMKNVIKNHNEGFCILMSGNDYPIKSRKFINSFLSKNSDKIFIDLKEAEKVWPTFNQGIEKYRINISPQSGNALQLKQGITINTLKHFIRGRINLTDLKRILLKKRKINIKMKFYGGSQWWAMNVCNLNNVCDFVKKNERQLFDFFKYSHVPDEFFFHSIIMHLIENGIQMEIQESLTYVNWKRKNCSLPVTFKTIDYNELIEQPPNKLFARKFDINSDKQILDIIDKNLS